MLAGDRVDVVLTQTFSAQGPSDPGRRSVGETILYNLRIIAVDQTLGASPKESNSKLVPSQESPIPKTITLEVQERQAEVLLVAEQLGKIQLTLRGQSLSGAVPQTPAAVPPTWAFDVSPALAKLGTAVPPLAKAQGSIEVIHGAKSEHLCPAGSGFVACP
jgi:pilus assembly protein CpaB